MIRKMAIQQLDNRWALIPRRRPGARRLGIALLICLVAASPTPSAAQGTSSERRIALVIGNANYGASLGRLGNAANDARDMGQKLTSLGFDVVQGFDLDKGQMNALIRKFDDKLRTDPEETVGLFYYAGHGVSVDGINWLVPLQAHLEYEEDIRDEGVSVRRIQSRMNRAGNRLNVLILDACRNNPLKRRFRGAPTGWAAINEAARGTFVAFGTSPGSRASDGNSDDRNGLFTKYLLQHIGTAGFTLEQVFKAVREDVHQQSHGKQLTWQNNATTGDFFFVPGQRRILTTPVATLPPWFLPGLALLGLILTGGSVQWWRQSQKLRWAQSVILSRELKKDQRPLAQELDRSRLLRREIVGYLKDVKSGQILGLIKSEDELRIGREQSCEIQIDDEVLSSQHCRVGHDPTSRRFWVQDDGSTNGTWLGPDRPVPKDRRNYLKDGEVFYLADQHHPLVLVSSAESGKEPVGFD